jgi:Zn finger protein HypA/HybF involved in hydrogenase expression
MAKSKNPRLVRKGTKVTRETVQCEKCGTDFERAIVHPYIKTCPECRGAKRAVRKAKNRFERFGCKHCREMVTANEVHAGRHDCPKCYQAWIKITDNVWKTEYNGELYIIRDTVVLGKWQKYGDVRRLIDES